MRPSKKYRPGSRRAAMASIASLVGVSVSTVDQWFYNGEFIPRLIDRHCKQHGWIIIKPVEEMAEPKQSTKVKNEQS